MNTELISAEPGKIDDDTSLIFIYVYNQFQSQNIRIK